MLTESQLKEFTTSGLLKLEGVLPIEAVTAMRDRVWQFLEKRDGMLPDDPTSWRGKELATIKGLANGKTFDAMLADDVLTAVRELVMGQSAARRAGTSRQLLVTFPNADQWVVPHRNWHYDLQALPAGSGPPPGVQVFAFLNAVRLRGGGTVIIAGSHRLLNDLSQSISPSVMKKRLPRRSDYFRALFNPDDSDRQHFMTESAQIGEVAVQVVEMTGEPGDVVLMDMRLLHTQAPNALDTPRMMLTERLLVEHG